MRLETIKMPENVVKLERLIDFLYSIVKSAYDGDVVDFNVLTEVFTKTVSNDGFTLSQTPTGYTKVTLEIIKKDSF